MRSPSILAVFVIVLSAAGCSDSPSGPSGSMGTLNVRLTDSPFTDAQAVLVTFSAVTAHRSDSDWTPVPFATGATTRTCDLKKLEASDDLLGSAVDAGAPPAALQRGATEDCPRPYRESQATFLLVEGESPCSAQG